MGDHKTDRCCKCPPNTSSMGVSDKEHEVWIPTAEECEVILFLSNLDEYLTPPQRTEAVITEAENMRTLNPLRLGPYCELRRSQNIPRIASPSWKPKMTRPVASRTMKRTANPYDAAIGTGRCTCRGCPSVHRYEHLQRHKS